MKPSTLSAALAAVVIAAAVGAGAAGQVSTVPKLGSGSVTVEGDVSVKGDVRVVNDLDVSARQSGPWRVTVDGVVSTAAPALPFVRAGRSYRIRWAENVFEDVVARETVGSWARVETARGGPGQVRWINLSAAWSIEERPS